MLLLQIFCSQLWARPATVQEAEKAVTGWLKTDARPLGTTIGHIITQVETFTDETGEPAYYIVYLRPTGFVIVSADNLVEPIIGFADDGTFDDSIQNPLGVLVTQDMKSRLAEVRDGQSQQSGIRAFTISESQSKWGRYISLAETSGGRISAFGLYSISDLRVAPLIKSKWAQLDVCNRFCYNYYTPNNYPCGCVATSIAQLMHYYQYPTTGIGKQDFTIKVDGKKRTAYTMGGDGKGSAYNWSNMPPAPDCTTSDVQLRAIGALCYDAGISAYMEYAADGSSSDALSAKEALITTFKYANAIKGYNQSFNIGSGLAVMINPNLDYGNPVMLGIWRRQSGHAVICDGYGYNDSTLYHHLNMGWAGSDDAWYNLPKIDAYNVYTSVIACLYNIFITGTGEIISGSVTDTSGIPISGATVTAKSGSLQYETITRDKGIYALANLPSETKYIISVTEPGYLFKDQSVTTGTSSDGEEISGNKWQIDFVGEIAEPLIEISKSVEYFRDQGSRYNIDVSIISDGNVASASVVAPNGIIYPLHYEGQGELCTEILFDTDSQLAAFPSGDWVFTVLHTDGGAYTTSIHYARPDGGNIPLVTQEPKPAIPGPNETDVPSLVTFTWEPVTDQNVTSIELEWKPVDSNGLSGKVSLPSIETKYGPVLLSPNTHYELEISFNEAYNGKSSDDIQFVIDADSEQKKWFHTHAK